MDRERYEALKNDKQKLLHEIIVSSIGNDDLIYNFSDDFKMAIIKQFIVLDDQELILGTYCFITNYGKIQELYSRYVINMHFKKLDFRSVHL